MDTIDMAFYNTIHSVLKLDFQIDCKHPITLAKIEHTCAPNGLISDPVLNGYLHLLGQDLAKTQSSEFSFHIFDTVMANQICQESLTPEFKPPFRRRRRGSPPRTLWVPEVRDLTSLIFFFDHLLYVQFNIFDKTLLLLPWFLPTEKHWILVAINTRAQSICVYDSLTAGDHIVMTVSKVCVDLL